MKDLLTKRKTSGFTQHLVPRLSARRWNNSSSKKKDSALSAGFTIIEVMIVLAIAGLIMVIVFIAVPQLQRNQRDQTRQNIANRVKAEMETYAGNNQGIYPFKNGCSTVGCITDFVNRYIGIGSGPPTTCNPSDGKVNTCDPTLSSPIVLGTGPSNGQPIACGVGPPSPDGSPCPGVTTQISGITHGQFYIFFGAKCSGENVVSSGNSTGLSPASVRTYAQIIGLDRDKTLYCIDNG